MTIGRCARNEHGCLRRCSWWREQFCAGSDASAINVVTTELRDTLDLCAHAPTLRLKPSLFKELQPKQLCATISTKLYMVNALTAPVWRVRVQIIGFMSTMWFIVARRIMKPTYSMSVPPSFPIQVDEPALTATVQAGVPQRILLDYLAAYKYAPAGMTDLFKIAGSQHSGGLQTGAAHPRTPSNAGHEHIMRKGVAEVA